MNAHEAKILTEAIRKLIDEEPRHTVATGPTGARLVKPAADAPAAVASAVKLPSPLDGVDELTTLVLNTLLGDVTLMERLKNALVDLCRVDPVALHLIAQRPVIEVETQRRVIRLDGTSLKGRVASLLAVGWFAQPRATSAVRRQLATTGGDPGGGGQLSGVLSELKRDGFLVNVNGQYQAAVGIDVREMEIEV